jgi:hypothetical protein
VVPGCGRALAAFAGADERVGTGMNMSDVETFIATLRGDDLDRVYDSVRRRRESLLDETFLVSLRSALESADLEYPADRVVQVVFTTWEWDNGWVLQESDAMITYANGETEEVDLSAVDDLLGEVGATYGGLGESSALIVTLPGGEMEMENYYP